MSYKLLPCPLCGSEANIVGGPEDWHPTSYDPDSGGDPYSIVCTGCECGMVLAFWDIDEAIAAWNRRADHSGEANGMVSNADKIRNMSDEELAIFLQTVKCRGAAAEACDAFWEDISYEIDWLRQPAKEENL